MSKRKSVRELSLEKLGELARDGVAKKPRLSRMELKVEEAKRKLGQEQMDAELAALPPENDRPKACPRCGKSARIRRRGVERTFQSLSGTHTIRRNYHYCEVCKEGFFPRDEFLGLPKEGDFSEELEMRAADFALNDPFDLAERRWNFHYAHQASANQFRQVAKRLGAMVDESDASILQGALLPPTAQPSQTLYVMNDGGMVPMREGKWNEVKLGVIFREENHLSHREAARGVITQARYVAYLGEQDGFKEELRTAYRIENGPGAKRVAWIADGAHGNWNLASLISPNAIQILDWHHAVENGMKCGRVLLGEDDPGLRDWQLRLEALLWPGDTLALIRELTQCKQGASRTERAAIDDLLRYYRCNAERMQYAHFAEEGLLIASGIVESGHRHVIQARMKRSGQHWGPTGGRQMARLRAAYATAGPEKVYAAIRWAHRSTVRAKSLLPRKHRVDLRRRGMANR